MTGQLEQAGRPSAVADGGYRIEMRYWKAALVGGPYTVLYRFGGMVEAVEKWERMMRLIREGVSGRRGELRLVGRDGSVLAGVEVRVVRAGQAARPSERA